MSAARLTSDVLDAEFIDVGDQRRGDRRARVRRSARGKIDTLFAATLLNQLAPEPARQGAYASQPNLRAGVVVNVRA